MDNLPEKMTILVVEDEKSLANIIKAKFDIKGFSVITAKDVDTALEILANQESIEAIWLDHYLLGKLDGLNFVSMIKQHDSKWRSIPVFVVSNTVSPDKMQTYIGLGVEKYFIKSNNTLETIIDELLEFIKNKR